MLPRILTFYTIQGRTKGKIPNIVYSIKDTLLKNWRLRRSEKEQEEKELGKVDDRPTPVTESHNSEDDSDELPDVQL